MDHHSEHYSVDNGYLQHAFYACKPGYIFEMCELFCSDNPCIWVCVGVGFHGFLYCYFVVGSRCYSLHLICGSIVTYMNALEATLNRNSVKLNLRYMEIYNSLNNI